MKYLIIFLIGVSLYSCMDSPFATYDSNLLFSADSIVSPGVNSFESPLLFGGSVKLNFSLKTNVPIPPEDSSSVRANIQLICKDPYMMDTIFTSRGNACNETYSCTLDLPAMSELYGSVYADTSNGHNYSLKMYNISIRK